MNKQILKDTLALVLITLVAAVCLSFVYELTKDGIAAAETKERMNSYYLVYPEAASFREEAEVPDAGAVSDPNVKVTAVLHALDAAGNETGCALSVVTASGYGGEIELSLGLSNDGTVTGMKVTSMSETSGLGAHCQDESWQAQFVGIRAREIVFTKLGKSAPNEIDAITSATVTTTAVVEAVNCGLDYARNVLGIGTEVQ